MYYTSYVELGGKGRQTEGGGMANVHDRELGPPLNPPSEESTDVTELLSKDFMRAGPKQSCSGPGGPGTAPTDADPATASANPTGRPELQWCFRVIQHWAQKVRPLESQVCKSLGVGCTRKGHDLGKMALPAAG